MTHFQSLSLINIILVFPFKNFIYSTYYHADLLFICMFAVYLPD